MIFLYNIGDIIERRRKMDKCKILNVMLPSVEKVEDIKSEKFSDPEQRSVSRCNGYCARSHRRIKKEATFKIRD